MAAISIDWQSVRVELARKRKELFDCFLEHPEQIHFAAEVRRLDDELFVCNDHIEQSRTRRNAKLN